MRRNLLWVAACAALLAGVAIAAGAQAADELADAVRLQTYESGERAKREQAFAVLERLSKTQPDDPYINTQFAAALSLKAKYSDEISQRVYWSKRSETLIDSIIAKNPDYLFARATRGVSNSLAPPFLKLADRAAEDFEHVLARAGQARTDQDHEAQILAHFYYARLIEREIEGGRMGGDALAKAKELRSTLRKRYPKFDASRLK